MIISQTVILMLSSIGDEATEQDNMTRQHCRLYRCYGSSSLHILGWRHILSHQTTKISRSSGTWKEEFPVMKYNFVFPNTRNGQVASLPISILSSICFCRDEFRSALFLYTCLQSIAITQIHTLNAKLETRRLLTVASEQRTSGFIIWLSGVGIAVRHTCPWTGLY